MEAVRHQLQNLAAGGLFVAIDFDIGAARTEPAVALASEALDWVVRAFRAAGASPMIGARLGPILAQAGLADVTTFGVQNYLPPDSRSGAVLLAGIVRSLAEAIQRATAWRLSSSLVSTPSNSASPTKCIANSPCFSRRPSWVRGGRQH